jgi:hypothetical protein
MSNEFREHRNTLARIGFTLDHHAPLQRVIRHHLTWIGILLPPVLAAAAWPVPGSAEAVFCLLRRLTGYPCMTCGFTRAFVRVLHGDGSGAWRDCPLGVIPPLLIVLALAVHLAALALGARVSWTPPDALRRYRLPLFVACASLVVANWTYRLIRGYA